MIRLERQLRAEIDKVKESLQEVMRDTATERTAVLEGQLQGQLNALRRVELAYQMDKEEWRKTWTF